ncbi:hypothetical protein BBJ28_00018676 [Nothophytophthora sp. Chile5]|nr:hypothetical protein BBJ28_00018676 [Nothophytophthora sp. Chile5]
MDWSALPDDFEDIGWDVFDEIRRVDCFALERDAEQERGQCRSPSSSPQRFASVRDGKEVHNSPEKSKHSDCKAVIDRMVQRQSQRLERAIRELRVDVERDVRRSAEMLSAIFFDRLGKPGLQGDATFVARLLEIQQQQVSGRFARLQDAHDRQEPVDLELLDNRFHQQQA